MIVVTGASGLLGANMVLTAVSRSADITPVFHRNTVRFPGSNSECVDLTDRDAVLSFVRRIQPQCVIHCAAETNVDGCEADPNAAKTGNALAAAYLAEGVSECGGRMVYISTDAVYRGDRGNYREGDTTDPVNEYARSKREGERLVLDRLKNALILRTNIYGWNVLNKNSLAEWIVNRLESGERVPGFRDVRFSPLLVNDLSDIVFDLIDRGASGVYNAAASEGCSKYEFARELACVFGFDPERIDSVSIRDSKLNAPRPLNTTLRTEAIAAALGRGMPDVKSGLRRFKKLRDSGFVARLKKCRGE